MERVTGRIGIDAKRSEIVDANASRPGFDHLGQSRRMDSWNASGERARRAKLRCAQRESLAATCARRFHSLENERCLTRASKRTARQRSQHPVRGDRKTRFLSARSGAFAGEGKTTEQSCDAVDARD